MAKSESKRTKTMSLLKESNIPSMIYYRIPLHLKRVFKNLGYSRGDLPLSEKISSNIFSIPMHPYLNKDNQDKIIEVLNNE